MRNRTAIHLSIAGAAGLLAATAMPLAASAHVTVAPESAEPGSYTVVTVKVPNESATASTTRVEVQLPTDTPFTSVRYVPVAGWSTELVSTELPEPVSVGENEITEAVTSVIWTADAGFEIGDGQLAQFDLSLGPVPDVGSIALPAVQTYTDGEIVAWDATDADAENPAPVLYVTEEPAGEQGGSPEDAEMTASPRSSPDVLARVFGVVGLVVGAVGIALAVTARRSQRDGR